MSADAGRPGATGPADDPQAPHPLRLEGLAIRRQPDDETCGPTCLHAVYRHFGREVSLDELVREVPTLEAGGTLAVTLGTHALWSGFEAELTTFDLRVFDPTWFAGAGVDLVQKLAAREALPAASAQRQAIAAYRAFLEAGGTIRMADLTTGLLRRPLSAGLPILTGLSSTWLYREPRELSGGRADDVAGDPQGHFVILSGYDAAQARVLVTDPLHPNPLALEHTYPVPLERVVAAILLGVLTFDANLLVLRPATASAP